MAKKKVQKTDGLGPYEIQRYRAALRDVWRHTLAHSLVRKRCAIDKDYSRCEKCKRKVPKIFVDHIINCGDLDGGYIERLSVPSNKLQGLCRECHDAKTKMERSKKKQKPKDPEDFY